MTRTDLRTILQVLTRLTEREGAALVTVQEAIQVLQEYGWQILCEEDDLRQFHHDAKPGTVTLSGKLELRLPPCVSRTLCQHAQLEEPR